MTVVIASYGNGPYRELAVKRAYPSAKAQCDEVLRVHYNHGTLAEVRNAGLAAVETEWVCFLDADDELEPGYLDAVAQGTADVRAPAVRYVPWGYRSANPSSHPAKVPRVVGAHHAQHACSAECLAEGNWLVVGSVVRTELVRAVGGFEEWPVYEDYALWARVWRQTDATFEAVPGAVYRAHVRSRSRNRASLTAQAKHRVHQEIARVVGLTVPA